jgi:hypothetical protein
MSEGGPQSKEFYIHRKIALSMGRYETQHEELHPEYMQTNRDTDLNETQFFGFSVPEAGIHSVLYTWCHPNLNTMSSGVMVTQGKHSILQAVDILDFRPFLSMDELTGGLSRYKTSGGFEVEVIEPGKKFRTKYLDKERNSSFDVIHSGLYEPCMWSSNLHFEQVMRTEGEVTLRGKTYAIDGRHVRDRSWGENRAQAPLKTPPISWITGSFDDGFAFHATAFDDPALDPIWKGHFDLPGETLRFGWVVVDGKQAALRGVRKLTRYDRDLFPESVEIEIVDEHDRKFSMTGKVTAAFPFNPWHNARWVICLAEWTRAGTAGKGYGDVQDGQWHDFLHALS